MSSNSQPQLQLHEPKRYPAKDRNKLDLTWYTGGTFAFPYTTTAVKRIKTPVTSYKMPTESPDRLTCHCLTSVFWYATTDFENER